MEAILKLVGGLLLCSVKFGMAFWATIRINQYNFIESVLFGLAAGFIGSASFIYAGDFLNKLLQMAGNRIRGNKPKKIRKKFTKANRRIVHIKARYGLIGIALVSPVLISLPVGAFLAVRYFHNKKKILLYMMSSVAAWTLLFSAINELF